MTGTNVALPVIRQSRQSMAGPAAAHCLMLGDLLQGLHQLGHVAGGGKDANDVACRVALDRGVVGLGCSH